MKTKQRHKRKNKDLVLPLVLGVALVGLLLHLVSD